MKALRDWNIKDCSAYLKSLNLKEYEVLDLSSAGAGNMNCTLRAVFKNNHSVILKQSSSYCENYPQVAAPIERLEKEYSFYNLCSVNAKLNNFLPKMINFDAKENILIMEDLGVSKDYSFVYGEENISDDDLVNISKILSEIHNTPKKEKTIFNRNMRTLNHEHIFDIPFRENNGLESLNDYSKNLCSNLKFKMNVAKLGGLYLYSGNDLLHGDFYPASWLATEKGIKVIDPEFGFHGLREFDIGVSIAHLKMSGHDEKKINLFLDSYALKFDKNLVLDFCAIEILRRILGVAKLPLSLNESELENLVVESSKRFL